MCHTQSEKPNHQKVQNLRMWNSHGLRGQVTMAIQNVAFLMVRSAAVLYVVCCTIGILSNSYASCCLLDDVQKGITIVLHQSTK